ncbi:MAG: hypothetical protein LBJ43_00725 [Propionibacteriaceae bacterium]|jgi:transposase-like protein|nr:hypothetical protein [Propionibacteriaceae bacterium]
MSRRYPDQVKSRAVEMVFSHLDEYDSVYQATRVVGSRVGVGAETLRRWVLFEWSKDTPAGMEAVAVRAEAV